MRKALIAMGLGLTLVISSCTTPDFSNPISQIVELTKKLCHFRPTFSTVFKLVSAFGGPNLVPVDEIAGKICEVVSPAEVKLTAVAPGSSLGRLRNVPIYGEFDKGAK